MFAYDLLPRLKYLTLTVENDSPYWEERLVFIGTQAQWNEVREMEWDLVLGE